MNKIIFIVLATLALCLTGCENDLNLDIKSRTHPSIVINGLIEADSIPELKLSKTNAYISSGKAKHSSEDSLRLQSVEVKMFIDDKLVDRQLLEQDPRSYNGIIFYRGKVAPREKQKIRIEASSPGYKTAYFEEVMPEKPQINSLTVSEVVTDYNHFSRIAHDENGKYVTYKIDVNMTDRTYPKENWLGLAVRNTTPHDVQSEFWYGDSENNFPVWTGYDPLFPKVCNDLMKGINENYISQLSLYVIPFFNTKRMSSKTANIDVRIPKISQHQEGSFYLYGLNEAYYKFGLIKYDLDLDDDDDFSIDEDSGLVEQTPTLTNIKNGIGLVLLRSGSVRPFRINP